MKKTIFYILAGIFVLCNIQFLQAQSTARYTITFTSTWNSTDHGTLPGTAHWSDLVGTTHNSGISFWNLGELASPGIENVAELGNNTAFNSEVNTAISGGTADQWLESPFSPFAAISSATLTNMVVSSDFPLLTLASMVAPSPDWFVGLSGYSLIDGSNNWKTNMTLDMFVFDAGTE
ncbi:MAG: sporulation protein SpoOM, partial [Flavobacteriaceae bacterium]|nr:sporulation protein SpoOM [Flavobacteriaceae bacterium]